MNTITGVCVCVCVGICYIPSTKQFYVQCEDILPSEAFCLVLTRIVMGLIYGFMVEVRIGFRLGLGWLG